MDDRGVSDRLDDFAGDRHAAVLRSLRAVRAGLPPVGPRRVAPASSCSDDLLDRDQGRRTTRELLRAVLTLRWRHHEQVRGSVSTWRRWRQHRIGVLAGPEAKQEMV